MSLLEAYLFLFVDSVMSCLALVPNTTMVFKAMIVFEGYNKALMTIVGTLGSALGASLNYLLGIALRSIKQRVKGQEDSKKLVELCDYANRKLAPLILLSFVPVSGVIITTASGFLRVKYRKFIAIFIMGRLLYYWYLSS